MHRPPRVPAFRGSPGRGRTSVACAAAGFLAALLALGAAAGPPPSHAAGSGPDTVEEEFDEYLVKAAFLYNLIGYTTWPADAFKDKREPIRLVVVGKDPFGERLEATFRRKRLHGRTVSIERVRDVPETIDAHVVFCAQLDVEERATVLERTAARPILVFGEIPGFAEDGATVNLLVEEKKLRFEVNTDAVKLARLTVSSQVLKLAKLVKTRKKK